MRFLPPLVLLLLALDAAPARADVRLDVRTDRKSLSIDETLTVQITVEARGGGSPEVTLPAFEGFEIVSEQEQRPMQFSYSFGKGAVVQSSVIRTLVLRPLRAGALVIKPVTVELEGQRRASAPISITVSGGGTGPKDQAQDQPPSDAAPVENTSTAGGLDLAQVEEGAFLRVVADKATPYVGEQVTVTMYLYLRNRLQASPAFDLEPTTDGFWVHDLLEPGQQPRPQRQIVQGAAYTVYPLRRFAAFPLRAGELTIGPLGLRIDTSSIFDVFNQRRGEPVLARRSAPLVFQVKPLPESSAKGPVAVGRFELESKLDRDQTATGDAVTLTVAVRGQGNVRNVSLATPQVQGLDVLEPEVRDLVEAPNDRVGGTRELRFLIVPRTPGRYTLPAFGFDAFDPQTEKHMRIESKPLELVVAGNAIAAAPSTPAQDQAAQAPEQADTPPPVPDYEWRPIRTESALLRARTPIARRAWFLPLLALPALLYAGWSALRASRKRAAERAQTKTNRADREARDKLASAASAAERNDAETFFAAASGAVLATLEARLEAPATGYTHAELRRYLIERGLDEALARQVVELLQRADTYRFGGPTTSASLGAELVTLRELRERLASFSPRPEAA